jgi:DNA-directed RNA polymerase specialized sigma24 family protein
MGTDGMNRVIGQLRAVLLRDGAGLTDGQLLECYVSRRDEAAFEALVRRHGPMVFGVCRRVLHHHQDSKDAFQATFLVLARKAASVAPPETVGNWLYGVAYRTALNAKRAAKRRRREVVRRERLARSYGTTSPVNAAAVGGHPGTRHSFRVPGIPPPGPGKRS